MHRLVLSKLAERLFFQKSGANLQIILFFIRDYSPFFFLAISYQPSFLTPIVILCNLARQQSFFSGNSH